MRARTTTPTILGAILLLGVAQTVSAQVRALPVDGDSTALLAQPALRVPYQPKLWRPLVEVTAMNALMWGFDYTVQRKDVFEISPGTFWRNVNRAPEWDTNTWTMNSVLHPYNGAIYYEAARAQGLSPLYSAGVTLFGSLQWEYLWETVRPSWNDLVNTTIGGVALGEGFARLGAAIRVDRRGGLLGIGQGLLAGVLDPGGVSDRTFFRGGTPLAFQQPQTHTRVMLGGALGSTSDLRTAGLQPVPTGGTRGQLMIETEYGDRFATGDRSFFDAFELDARFSYGTDGISLDRLHVYGRLLGGVVGSGAPNTALYLDQQFDFDRNPAYALAGQSLNGSLRHRRTLGKGWELRGQAGVRAMPVAAVSSEKALDALTEMEHCSESSGEIQRTYDYGFGLGAGVGASLRRNGFKMLELSYETNLVRTFSGADGAHLLHQVELRGTLPVTRTLSVFGGVELQSRQTDYDGYDDVNHTSHAFSLGMSFGAF